MQDRVRLILLSFLMLFLELALIRWTGSNIVFLSYFSNFVLLGSFLGIGLGFLRANAPEDMFRWAIVVLAFLTGFVLIFPVAINQTGTQLIYFGGVIGGLPIWVILPIIFIAVAAIMAFVAQGVARVFARFEPLEAYRLDILGSLAGIAAFTLLSFLGAPPVAWGAIVAITFLALYAPSVRPLQIVAALGLIVMLGHESLTPGLSWSPYYKIRIATRYPGLLDLYVNGIPHQMIESVALRRETEPLYFMPYAWLRSNPLSNVLVIGAGGGTDTAIALSEGAKHIDAVEIDPRIYQLGRRLNPNHPYQDPRVTIHINDGRAFLHRTTTKYDLILFALPDSLALVTGQSSLRLESYLFTVEAIDAARAHLKPDGAFAMYNEYRAQWLIDRYARTLEVVYGESPCIHVVGRSGWAALLMVGLRPSNVVCPARWDPAGRFVPTPVTDDYPFPYLRTRSLPTMYIAALALILLVSLVLIRAAAGPMTQMRSYADLFFMGAAFLLLETKNVVQFALLFGTTWFVNALVFFGILIAVLLAIEVSRRVRFRNPNLVYIVLLLTLAVAWVVPPEQLLSLGVGLRFAIAVTLAFAPIFLANLVFTQRFRDVGSSTLAFATNLLGAMVGGVLEYSSLIFGYRFLLILVAVLYALAFLFGRKYLTGAVSGGNNATA